MRLKLALLTTALASGLGSTAALAEDAPGAKSDITIVDNSGAANVPGTQSEGSTKSENPGALSAPEKNATGDQPSGTRQRERGLGCQRAGRQRGWRQFGPEPGLAVGTEKDSNNKM
jgi:hypothetical protein